MGFLHPDKIFEVLKFTIMDLMAKRGLPEVPLEIFEFWHKTYGLAHIFVDSSFSEFNILVYLTKGKLILAKYPINRSEGDLYLFNGLFIPEKQIMSALQLKAFW